MAWEGTSRSYGTTREFSVVPACPVSSRTDDERDRDDQRLLADARCARRSTPSSTATTRRSSPRRWRPSTTRGVTPAHRFNDGQNFHPTQPARPLRPPLRRDHGRRAAHRAGPRGAVRVTPGFLWILFGVVPRRGGARLRHPGGLARGGTGARSPRSRARSSGRGRPRSSRSRSSSSSSSRSPVSASSSSRRSPRARGATFTIGVVDPDRPLDGPLHVPAPQGEGRRGPAIGVILLVVALVVGHGSIRAGPRPSTRSTSRSPSTASRRRSRSTASSRPCCRCGCCSARATTSRAT